MEERRRKQWKRGKEEVEEVEKGRWRGGGRSRVELFIIIDEFWLWLVVFDGEVDQVNKARSIK